METVYLCCAAIGGTFILCQFIMTLVGMGGGHEFVGADHFEAGDGGFTGHDVGHGNESTWFLGVLTVRTLSAAMAFFGLTGVIGQRNSLDPLTTAMLAVCAGGAAIYLVSWIMQLLVKFNADGTVRIDRAAGCDGTVYLPIPAGKSSPGKVQVNVLNRTLEYRAVSQDALPTGTPITVVAVIGSDTVEVSHKKV